MTRRVDVASDSRKRGDHDTTPLPYSHRALTTSVQDLRRRKVRRAARARVRAWQQSYRAGA